MKKIALLATALTTSTLLWAQSNPAPVAVEEAGGSWTLTSSVTSQYMFRGVRLGGPSFQPSIEYDAGGLGLGVWANVPLKDKIDGQSDPEFDFYGFYSVEVAKDLSIVPGFTFYTYPDADESNGYYKGTLEPSIALNYTIGGLKLTPKLYYDFSLKGPTAEVTAAFAIPLTNLGTELDFTATAGTFKWTDYASETNPAIKNWGDYYSVGVAAPYQISKSSKVTIGWSYTAGSNNYLKQGTDGKTRNSAALGRGVLTINYAFTF